MQPGNGRTRTRRCPSRSVQPVLACASDVNSGNFGTLDFPRTDNTSSDDIAVNIAVGLEPPSRRVARVGGRDPVAAGECEEGEHEAVISVHDTLRTGTNCLDTVTGGLAPNDATAGLVTGAGGHPGSLRTAPTTEDCDPDGGSTSARQHLPQPDDPPERRHAVVLPPRRRRHRCSDLMDPDYAEATRRSSTVRSSTRRASSTCRCFKIQPSAAAPRGTPSSTSAPAFITDEVALRTTTRATHTASGEQRRRVPEQQDRAARRWSSSTSTPCRTRPRTSLIDYLGVGRRIVRLID